MCKVYWGQLVGIYHLGYSRSSPKEVKLDSMAQRHTKLAFTINHTAGLSGLAQGLRHTKQLMPGRIFQAFRNCLFQELVKGQVFICNMQGLSNWGLLS